MMWQDRIEDWFWPAFEMYLPVEQRPAKEEKIAEYRMHMLATLLALYQIKTNDVVARELGIPKYTVINTARHYGLKKSHQTRSMICRANSSKHKSKNIH